MKRATGEIADESLDFLLRMIRNGTGQLCPGRECAV